MTKEQKRQYDREYRQRNLVRLREKDRWRSLSPERRAQKIESQLRRRAANPNAFLEYQREYYQRNKQKWTEKRKQRQAMPDYPELQRWYSVKCKYGVTKSQFDAMLSAQNGVCGICGGLPVGKNKQWHIDHNHETGEIRGLLCMACNFAIERVDNCPDWLLKAGEWVKRPR